MADLQQYVINEAEVKPEQKVIMRSILNKNKQMFQKWR